jgi:hypothetical protein
MKANEGKVARTSQDSGPALPRMGLSKWSQIAPFLPVGRETWRKLCIAGKAPAPIRLSDRCTVYKNEEVHRYLSDPLSYSVDVA